MISFDVFALSPQGYEVHPQLQGETVYGDALELLGRLEVDGFTVQNKVGAQASSNGQVHYCQAHGVEYKRFEKDGKAWYSHKTTDGGWCKKPTGKAKITS